MRTPVRLWLCLVNALLTEHPLYRFNKKVVDKIKPGWETTTGKPVWKNIITEVVPEPESRSKRETGEGEEPAEEEKAPVLQDNPVEEEGLAEEGED
jgi:hypothetical protein